MSLERSPRTRERFDRGWMFHRGDVEINRLANAGMVGGLTDCVRYVEGKDWSYMAKVEPTDAEELPRGWVPVDLPHDWVIEQTYENKPELASRGFLPTGVGCYRKLFDVPAEAEGKAISIEFDGVFRNSTVYVNGHRLGTHLSGYTSFAYDISSVLRYGDEGRNCIFVRVDATDPEGWWYDGGGIYRHVWLTQTERLHVARWGTYITTPEVTSRAATVCVRTTVANEHLDAKDCEVTTRIVSPSGSEVATASASLQVAAQDTAETAQALTVELPQLWSLETPHLYRAISEVRLADGLVDTYETAFGIRTIEFTADRGFLLNGQHVLLKGMCCHQDFAGVGVAMTERMNEYRIEQLKSMGCNAYRCAHHPPMPELLDICDRMGMLVMDENRSIKVSTDGLADLDSMVRRDRNHPCIILWSVENEEAMQYVPKMGARVVRVLANRVRKLDPTRPVTAAITRGFDETEYRDSLDVIGYNYWQVTEREFDGVQMALNLRDHVTNPHRKQYGSETASNPCARGIYEPDEVKGYYSPFTNDHRNIAWNTDCVEKTWQQVIEHPFLAGVFAWTGFDYRGESGATRWPNHTSQFGPFDLCGFPKDKYHWYKAIWTEAPTVHIMPHWTWPGREGEELTVWVFSNCDEVELLLNGASLGRKAMPPASHLEWAVGYVPGTLSARAWKDGRLAAETAVETTTPAARISLVPDRPAIAADGGDVALVKVAILDDRCRVVPHADNEVSFAVEGPGRILGVGNGDPASLEPDRASLRRAFSGLCLAIVQSTGQPGTIVVRATSPGLPGASAEIAASQ